MTRGRRRARRLRHTLPPVPALPAAPEPEPEPPTALVYPRQLTTAELTGGKDDTQLTAELAAALRKVPACSHCGGRHTRACPRVKRMEFHPNGALASVEFWREGQWSDTEIIWQEDLLNED